ncbi:Pre-mRNA-splicing factor cef-1 [Erysiphe neolycopersici]|uniref:Pre-mRNA-splicing factor cef-1 n=1 Tax=Erysiphe neolycopersici TaxID=212602 RepID=A0A420HSR6_9PEZI|nr:Pre-mRNA-splicing factor cef-1 [Erysiphe neolycopersici]
MPVVKGGVWTNIEDEILKASVSKYGLNQWARVSSLLARKTPKQCKARWNEWLDPGIRKIEWSKEEDEKLLHLAKLMPTQWRTIAPIVGRTATQCLERYQRLLDEAEQKEAGELGLGGPDGGETKAPSADDVRRLRPGEVDPDPESKPARPDTVDLDEDEKEMLSEARARLANTQGKKAKRKARERQLEESRRLAVLQKRRELKNAGINIKIVNRKKGQMDYNADIPFEKKAAPGFYDTEEETLQNEREREIFDPRKQQLANKRKVTQEDDSGRKKRKGDKEAPSASYQAAMKAGQQQKIREAEQSSKRKPLVLPAPQVGDGELEEIVKMGMIGERANIMAKTSDNDATKGLVNTYSAINTGAPIRTPRAPAQEDHIANEIRNIRALTNTQSSLLGGENTPLYHGTGSTGFEGANPRKQVIATPNPLATPFHAANGIGATPMRTPGIPGDAPFRTPRDNFSLNASDQIQYPESTPQQIQLRNQAIKNRLKQGLLSLPKPKETEWELELPEIKNEPVKNLEISEDAELIDRRNRLAKEAREKEEFLRKTKVMQKLLPRPMNFDTQAMLNKTLEIAEPIQAIILREATLLQANDAMPSSTAQDAKRNPDSTNLESFTLDDLEKARLEIINAMPQGYIEQATATSQKIWDHQPHPLLPLTLDCNGSREDELLENKKNIFNLLQSAHESLISIATQNNKTEKKLAKYLGGYHQRAKTLRQKTVDASSSLDQVTRSLESFHLLKYSEQTVIQIRLERLKEEFTFVSRRERLAQDMYRELTQEFGRG